MGKHTRLAKSEYSGLPDDVLDELEDGMRAAFATATTAVKEGNAAPQLLREMAGMTRAIVGIQAERRAREKARVVTLQNIKRAIVIAWLREQGPDERELIAREVAAMNAGGSVLG